MTTLGSSIFSAGTLDQSKSGASSNFTANVGYLYEIDFAAGTPTQDLDITLPSSPSQGDAIGIWLETADPTYHVNILSGSKKIHGLTVTAESFATLRNANDFILLRFRDDTLGWVVEGGGPNIALELLDSKTATFTAAIGPESKKTYSVDCTSGAVVATLPAANTCKNKTFTFIKTDSGTNTLTIDGSGSETINGSTTIVLRHVWEMVTIVCDGSNWKITSKSIKPVFETQTISFVATDPGPHVDKKIIRADATSGAIVITLPTAASMKGRAITAIKIDASSNGVSFDGDGSETINGATTHSIGTTQWSKATILSDGTEWFVVAD